MFVRDFEKAREMRKSSSSIVVFVIRLEDGKCLPLYLVTDLCILTIFENIRMWRQSVIEYCIAEDIKYSFFISIGYAE